MILSWSCYCQLMETHHVEKFHPFSIANLDSTGSAVTVITRPGSRCKQTSRVDLLSLLPAREILLAPAESHTILPSGKPASFLGVLVHGVALHRLEGPGPAAGGGRETHLLYVDGEHGELGGGQPACSTCVRTESSERSCNCQIKRKICDQGNYFLSAVTNNRNK